MSKTYIHFGSDHFDPNKFCPIKNDTYQIDGQTILGFGKPLDGGLWASPAPIRKGLRTEWERFVIRELSEERKERLASSFRFTLKDDAKIIYVEKPEDVFKLPGRYRFPQEDITKPEKDFMNKFIARFYEEYYIDFEELVKQGFDGIEIQMNNDLRYVLYGWDVSSLLIFNPLILDMGS